MNKSAIIIRAIPFILFVLLTSLQGEWGEASRYWVYILKTGIVGGCIIWLWPRIQEMRPIFSWEAVFAGVVVFILWVGLDPFYPKVRELWSMVSGEEYVPPLVWNPFACFGETSFIAWICVVVRILSASLLVPLVEEVFYRSFLYRFIIKEKFEEIPLKAFYPFSFIIVSLLFGFVHQEWIAGVLCGIIYQGLVCWKGRLGDAIVAHGLSNLLLGVWVPWQRAWNFW